MLPNPTWCPTQGHNQFVDWDLGFVTWPPVSPSRCSAVTVFGCPMSLLKFCNLKATQPDIVVAGSKTVAIYHQIYMGLTSGSSMSNDQLFNHQPAALAINQPSMKHQLTIIKMDLPDGLVSPHLLPGQLLCSRCLELQQGSLVPVVKERRQEHSWTLGLQ